MKITKIICIGLIIASFSEIFSQVQVVYAAEAVRLTNGSYIVTSGINADKCMDVSEGRSDNGTNIQLWSSNDTTAQRFYITEASSGWYSIRNIYSAKAIDVAGGIKGNGINVQLYEWNGTDAQLWKFYDAGNGYYYIKNKLGYYLDVSGACMEDGTNIQVYQFNGTKAQKWKLTPAEGIYTFTPGISSLKHLDVDGAKNANGTNIQIWSINNTYAQMFRIKKEQSGWYSIWNVKSKRVIDVAGGVKGNGVNVQLYEWNGTDAQLWNFYDAGNGYYYIKNKLGYYLDVSGGYSTDGTNVQVYQLNGTKAQKWKLEPVDLTKNIKEYVVSELYKDGITNIETVYHKLLYYYTNFNHGKKYDIKRENVWNALFTDIIYPGKTGVFLFDGMVITPEHMGNIMYGYTGNILGFCDKLIYQGGGYAGSDGTYINDADKYYGDTEVDHNFISVGIKISGSKSTIDFDFSDLPAWCIKLLKNML